MLRLEQIQSTRIWETFYIRFCPKTQKKCQYFSFLRFINFFLFLWNDFTQPRSICLINTVLLISILTHFMTFYVIWNMSQNDIKWHFKTFYGICHIKCIKLNYVNMGIKRTVLIRQIDLSFTFISLTQWITWGFLLFRWISWFCRSYNIIDKNSAYW